ncbi:MAG: UPF0182 family protein, partial [Coleofasciculus sp. S288]|nr:UPF0182 family protein [Coleofasciculus sp. S288]
MGRRFWNPIFRSVILLLGLWLSWDLLSHLVTEILWFQKVGYLQAFLLRLQTQLGLWTVVASISAGFSLSNLFLANRLKWKLGAGEWGLGKGRTAAIGDWRLETRDFSTQVLSGSTASRSTSPQPPGFPNPFLSPIPNHPLRKQNVPESSVTLTLRSLLPTVIVLSLVVGVMLLHYSRIALGFWHRDWSLPNVTPPLPSFLNWVSVQQLLLQELPIPIQILQGAVLVLIAIALIVNSQFWLTAIAVAMSLFFGLVFAEHWTRTLQYFHPTAFNAVEPLFGRDISFYVFSFPLWQLFDFWLGGLFLFSLIAVTLIYLTSGDSLSQGKFPGFSPRQLRHLYGLASSVAAALALHHWLLRYELLYSTRGVIYGANYTAVKAQLPLYTGLSILAAAIAIFLLVKTIFWFQHLKTTGKRLLMVLVLYLVVAVTASAVVPTGVQRFVVQPNELAREQPYIQRSIALTRQAFALEDIEVETFFPEGELTAASLAENDLTIRNIRLWDTRPLLQTNRQLQQIRLYYKFPDADIDRYTLQSEVEAVPPIVPAPNAEPLEAPPVTTEKQQVIIAARELDYSAVPEQAQTWVNQHLIYTHGYGFTLSPVNTIGAGGLPEYYVKNIGIGVATDGAGTLQTSSERIRASIPIGAPRI